MRRGWRTRRRVGKVFWGGGVEGFIVGFWHARTSGGGTRRDWHSRVVRPVHEAADTLRAEQENEDAKYKEIRVLANNDGLLQLEVAATDHPVLLEVEETH